VGNLTVVYGGNGSGKSGYVRILKKACGKAHAIDLKPNVFQPTPLDRGCTITYAVDGVSTPISWAASAGPIEALRSVDIFDSSCGTVYLDGEMETTYTPAAVVLLEELARACNRIRTVLEVELRALISRLPPLPSQYADTRTGSAYSSLQASQPPVALQGILVWSEAAAQSLTHLDERLKADDPAALAQQKRSLRRHVDELRGSLAAASMAVNPAVCEHLHDLRETALTRRRAAVEAARVTSASSILDGVGESTWRRLWEAARSYSAQGAYPGREFPNLDRDARCVLCHQVLSVAARERMRGFDAYVRGVLEREAAHAELAWDAAVKALPTRPTDETLRTVCDAAGLRDDRRFREIRAAWEAVKAAVDEISDPQRTTPSQGVDSQAFAVLEGMAAESATLERQAAQLDRDAAEFDRTSAELDKLDLQARQWTAQQAVAILAEVERLREVARYEEWKGATNTASISQKAGTVAESLITEAYVARFNHELERLGAKHIQVELVKTRTERGRAKHRIRLKGLQVQDASPKLVLSEGECRVVTLAAFLADVTGKDQSASFVFDDPISSLDQRYEEHTASRLIELSADRQVIAFTHRLSFLGIMCDKADPVQVHLKLEHWGAGEPGQIPLFGKNPLGALRNLRGERLAKAREVLEAQGHEAYYPLGISICTDLRILMERVVELELLSDVVQRHRREVHTRNKVINLCRITAADCELIEDIMGKYSCLVHSQSKELPVDIPAPDGIAADIDRVLDWLGEFRARCPTGG
jgi:energy-coupling factor transporter ATP-binding protein EcfA2